MGRLSRRVTARVASSALIILEPCSHLYRTGARTTDAELNEILMRSSVLARLTINGDYSVQALTKNRMMSERPSVYSNDRPGA
jgi:hypothetical protein